MSQVPIEGPGSWTAELADRLEEPTVVAPLAPAIVDDVAIRVKRFGFAIVRSEPCATDAVSLRARSNELQRFGDVLGTPVVQSPRNELVEDVKDYSDMEPSDDRGYRSGGELSPHSDPPTLILLHCVRPAKVGGETSLVSVAAIVERMTETDPELVDELFDEFPTWRVAGQHGIAEAGPGDRKQPVLARQDGVLSCVLYRPFIEQAACARGEPLTERQVAALDLFEQQSTSPDLTLRFILQPGDTLVLHNRSVLHARTDYTDWPDLDRRRLLLRMWIDSPDQFSVHPAHELGDFFSPH